MNDNLFIVNSQIPLFTALFQLCRRQLDGDAGQRRALSALARVLAKLPSVTAGLHSPKFGCLVALGHRKVDDVAGAQDRFALTQVVCHILVDGFDDGVVYGCPQWIPVGICAQLRAGRNIGTAQIVQESYPLAKARHESRADYVLVIYRSDSLQALENGT